MLCTYYPNSEEINEIFSQFGTLQSGKQGIIAEKLNDTRSFSVDDNQYRITYLPDINNCKLPEIDADNINTGFLWTPTMLTSWVKSGPDKFLLMPFAYRSDMQLSVVNVERSSILNYIKHNTSLESRLFCEAPKLSWDTIKDYCNSTLNSIIFFSSLGSILFQVLLFVMMFSFILNLSANNTGAPVLKYKTRYIIGIYTSFPPLLIATIFRAFELPFLSFNSVYVLCFSIYLIVVFTHLQLAINSGGQNKIEQ